MPSVGTRCLRAVLRDSRLGGGLAMGVVGWLRDRVRGGSLLSVLQRLPNIATARIGVGSSIRDLGWQHLGERGTELDEYDRGIVDRDCRGDRH